MKRAFFTGLTGIVISAAGWCIFNFGILPAGQACHWDEVAHVIFGANIYYDLIQKDLLNFLFDIYRQVYWPPLHSLLIGTAFYFTGLSFITARAVSLVLFLLMVVVMVQSARELNKNKPVIAGLTALVLTLSTPSLVLFSSMSMLEIPGMFFMALSFLIYFKLNRHKTMPKAHMLLGFAVTLTYFTKQHYAALLVLVVMINELIENRFRVHLLFNRNNYYALLPLAVSLLIWFAYPPKIISTIESLASTPWGIENTYSLDGWLFYPRALIQMAGSPILFAVYSLCLFTACKFFNDKNIRFLILFTLILFVIGELHHNKCPRHLFPIIPAMILLTSHMMAHAWHVSSRSGSIAKFRTAAFLTIAFYIFAVFVIASSYKGPYEQHSMEVSEYILEKAGTEKPVLILGSMDLHLQNPPMIDWQLITKLQDFDPPQAGIATSSEEVKKLKRALDRFSAPAWLIDALQPILVRSDHIGKSRSIYLGNYPFGFKSREAFDLFFQELVSKGGFKHVIVATSLQDTAKYPLSYFLPGLTRLGFVETSTFRSSNTRVDEYIR